MNKILFATLLVMFSSSTNLFACESVKILYEGNQELEKYTNDGHRNAQKLHRESLKIATKKAEEGDHSCMEAMGYYYSDANVLAQRELFYPESEYYQKQKITSPDWVYAYMWMLVSLDEPRMIDRYKNDVEKLGRILNQQIVQEAQSLARKCRRNNYKDCG